MKPENREVLVVAAPVFIAQAIVGIALILGATVIISNHTIWATLIGVVQ